MNICSEGHDEIVYDQADCPACDLIDLADEREAMADDLQDTIDDLTAELANRGDQAHG